MLTCSVLYFSMKIFRETKESELQNLLRAKRELEAKLTKHGHSFQDDVETASKMEMSIGNIYTTHTHFCDWAYWTCCSVAGRNSGEWWMQAESEPSIVSANQLQTNTFKGPEFAHASLEMDGPFLNINKGLY